MRLTSVLQERIEFFFTADGGLGAMAGNDDGVLGQGHELFVDGADDLAAVATRQICPADAVAEQGIAGDKLVLRRDPQAQAALGVAGRMQDVEHAITEGERVAVARGDVYAGFFGRFHTEPGGLHIEVLVQFEVRRVHPDRSAGYRLEFGGAADVIDVSVRDHDGGDTESMAFEDGLNALDVVTRIHDDGFPCLLIAEDGAVALEQADGQDLVDHALILAALHIFYRRGVHGAPMRGTLYSMRAVGRPALRHRKRRRGYQNTNGLESYTRG